MNHSIAKNATFDETTSNETNLGDIALDETAAKDISLVNSNFDWAKIAYYVHLSRAMDHREETE